MAVQPPVISDVDWDDWSVGHISKHGVLPDQVEQVLFGSPIFLESYKGRLVALGPDVGGRILVVVIGPTPGVPGSWYIFSARPASRKERRLLAESRRSENEI